MLKKLILAVAVMGLIGAATSTASAQWYGRGGYCPSPYYHNSYRPSYGGVYYRGPSTYFGPSYGYGGYRGFRSYGGYGGYGGYGYGGYGYGRSGISIRIGF